ncbi:MAG: nuclear transport factor 2 family protein [Alphaproteobacteria bacterium]|nr:nuclear transport factor 2 family protein [Alphaproteobacteria bacterium]
MKRIITILFLGFTGIIYAQNSVEQDIRKILNDQVDAWDRGKIENFMSAYWQSDSLIFFTSKGIVSGYNNMLNYYKNAYPSRVAMGDLNFEILSITKINETALYVLGKWQLENNDGIKSGGFSLVFKKIQGQWKIILDHTS